MAPNMQGVPGTGSGLGLDWVWTGSGLGLDWVWTRSGPGPDRYRQSVVVPVPVPKILSGTRLSSLQSSKNGLGPDQTELPQHYRAMWAGTHQCWLKGMGGMKIRVRAVSVRPEVSVSCISKKKGVARGHMGRRQQGASNRVEEKCQWQDTSVWAEGHGWGPRCLPIQCVCPYMLASHPWQGHVHVRVVGGYG